MSEWGFIQGLSHNPPIGYASVHELDKPRIVLPDDQMHHLMRNDVAQAFRALCSQMRIEADIARVGVATSPLRLHTLNVELLWLCANDAFPLSN